MRVRALAALSVLAAAVVIPSSSAHAAGGTPTAAVPRPLAVTNPQTSTIQGVITDVGSGGPIQGACVTVYGIYARGVLAHTCTGPDGRYVIENARGTALRMRATANGQERWWPGALDYANSSAFNAPWIGSFTGDFTFGPQGTVRGALTRPDGSAAVRATAYFHPVGADKAVRTAVAVDGSYTAALPVGRYQVQFAGYGLQWHPDAADRAAATVVEVTDGGVVQLDQRFLPTDPPAAGPALSSVSGTVTARPDGTPVAGAEVTVYGLGYEVLGTARTGADGRYEVPNQLTGAQVSVKASAPGLADTWAPDDPAATASTVVGQTLNIAMGAGSGRLKLRIPDYDGGLPYPGIRAVLSTPDATWTYPAFVRFDGTADLDGVPAGQYRIRILPGARPGSSQPVQWYPQSLDAAGAGVVTVTGGQTTEITEQLLTPAVVDVTVLDAATGDPIAGACDSGSGPQLCTDATGSYRRFLGWQPVSTRISVSHAPYHFPAGQDITAAPGEILKLTFRLERGAQIATTVTDPPNENTNTSRSVCASTVAFGWGRTHGNLACAVPAADGSVLLGPYRPGQFRLYVSARGAGGAQWLGPQGGTGDPMKAAVLDLRTGETTSAPPIVFDRMGGLQATVLDAVNGQPVAGSCGYVAPAVGCHPAVNGFQYLDLGPYEWTFEVHGFNYAKLVTTAKVASDRTTDVTIRLPLGTGIGSFTLDPPATGDWAVVAYDAWSGIDLSAAQNGAGLRLSPNRAVVLKVRHNGGTECWAYFGSGSRTTPYLAVGTADIAKMTFTPGVNCLPRVPFRLALPMRPLPGPVFVTTFASSPWLRGSTGGTGTTGTSAAGTGEVPVSPWGAPTAARLARVKN